MIWIGIAVVMMFLLIYFTSVRIQIEYKRAKENDQIHIQAGIWFGLITLKFNIPLLQLQSLVKGVRVEEGVTSATPTPKAPEMQKSKFRFTPKEFYRYLRRFYRLRDQVHDLNQIAKQTLKKVRCEQFEWYTRVGIGDAASTGVLTGVIWGIKTTFIGLFSQYVTLRTTPRMNVVPAFQGQKLDTRFFCILRFRVGNAIIAGIRILFKFRKGREGIWQNTLFRA